MRSLSWRAVLVALLVLGALAALSPGGARAAPPAQMPPLPPGVLPPPGACWVPAASPQGPVYLCNTGVVVLAVPAVLPPAVGPPSALPATAPQAQAPTPPSAPLTVGDLAPMGLLLPGISP